MSFTTYAIQRQSFFHTELFTEIRSACACRLANSLLALYTEMSAGIYNASNYWKFEASQISCDDLVLQYGLIVHF